MWVILSNGVFNLREVEPAVLEVADRVVRDSHERACPRGFVLKQVRPFPENYLLASATLRTHGNQVSHGAAVGHGGWRRERRGEG